jgi:hypothetical protein
MSSISLLRTPLIIGLLVLGVLTLPTGALSASDAHSDRVQFSDGREVLGVLELSGAVQVHDGSTMRSIPPDQVSDIECRALSEDMVQGWRFVEPGQPRKENVGKPYPVRHLQAIITTVSGERISGHLTTTVAWMTPQVDADRERIILPAKQEGNPGQTLADLVYPVHLAFGTHAHPDASCRVQLGDAFAKQALVVISRGALARSEALAVPATPGLFQLPGPLEVPAFFASRSEQMITVGWPSGASAAQTALIQRAVDQAQDFLDYRQLLGVWADGDDQLYGLLMLYRQGPTTMAGPERPWRLEVWRWKHEQDHLMWAARAYFYRGLAANVSALPTVYLQHAWWSQTITAGVCTLPEGPHGR